MILQESDLPALFYPYPPSQEITIEEFSNLCISRVRLLRTIDQLSENIRMMDIPDEQRMNTKIIKQHRDLSESDLNKDNNSHFITRLAFCSEEDKTKWFLNQESRLFKARISELNIEEKQKLAEKMKIEFNILDQIEYREIESELRDSFSRYYKKQYNKEKITITNKHFFKVNFKDALYFVGTLKCYLKRGVAYLYIQDIPTLLMDAFKIKLQKQMLLARQHYRSIVEHDERLAPLLLNISEMYLGKDYSQQTTKSKHGKISLAELDILSKRSFPPCMRHLNDNMKVMHHLKHEGRLQFSLFLKGAGLSFEDAYTYWKTEFTKKITNEQFDKQYGYFLRYNYGKEGNRTDWNPKSCDNIIRNHPPGNNEYHGCPFRHLNEGSITSLLKKMGVDTNGKPYQDVMEKVRGKHFQVACKYVFQILHPNRTGNLDSEFDGQHPNSYFEASMNYHAGEKANSNNKTVNNK